MIFPSGHCNAMSTSSSYPCVMFTHTLFSCEAAVPDIPLTTMLEVMLDVPSGILNVLLFEKSRLGFASVLLAVNVVPALPEQIVF